MIVLMVTTFREEQNIIFLFERKIWSDHPTEGLKLWLCQDILPVIQFQVVVHEACIGF